MRNVDKAVVEDFGNEWESYDYSQQGDAETRKVFDQYFTIFPFDELPPRAEGFDMGCGSGRWAKFVAARVGKLNCIDPSPKSIKVARENTREHCNVFFEVGSVSDNGLNDGSQDFGYCLGVLHHIPDTEQGIRDCARLLKRDAPFLIYLYYSLDNKPAWFRFIWKISNLFRLLISSLPFPAKKAITKLIAATVYWPLAKLSLLFERVALPYANIPLSDYRHKNFYIMSTDALDRFGTKLEKRFSRREIEDMLVANGFKECRFSEETPYWVCVAYKA